MFWIVTAFYYHIYYAKLGHASQDKHIMLVGHVLGILVCGSTRDVSLAVISVPERHHQAKMETITVRLRLLSDIF